MFLFSQDPVSFNEGSSAKCYVAGFENRRFEFELVISSSTSTGFSLLVVFVLGLSLIVIILLGDWAISKHILTLILKNSRAVGSISNFCVTPRDGIFHSVRYQREEPRACQSDPQGYDRQRNSHTIGKPEFFFKRQVHPK